MGEIETPWPDGSVRREYADGVWAYACGISAETHPDYTKAVGIAEREGWPAWFIRSRVDVDAVLEGCWLDMERGIAAVGWLESNLIHTMGAWAGKPFDLFDWQVYDVIVPLFGWVRKDGTRRFRKAAIWVPKKNGKSGLASGFALLLTCGDGEPSAHVYCAAKAKHQADTVHKQARAFAKKSPTLRGQLRVLDSTYRIVHPESDSFFAAVSSDAGIQEGLNWHALVMDELHVVDRALFASLEEGGMARREPLMLNISTAGEYDETSIGWTIWDYSQKVLSGDVVDTSFFARIYAADKDADPGDPVVWRAANPSLGITFQEDVLKAKWERTKASASTLPDFLRYHLNVWVQAQQRWLPPDEWHACRDDIPDDQLVGRPCYAGMDLSSVRDMTAVALLFPPWKDDQRWRVRVRYWLPGENITDLGRKASAPYPSWVRDGWLSLTDGNIVDDQAVRRFIVEASKIYDLREVAFDRYLSTSVVTQLSESDNIPMVEFGQGFISMNPAIKELERLIAGREIAHDGNPILSWNVSNAQLSRDAADNVKLVRGNKGKAMRYHIDGLIALCMAVGRAAQNKGQRTTSVYEERGMVFL